jgi:hypothetical protein
MEEVVQYRLLREIQEARVVVAPAAMAEAQEIHQQQYLYKVMQALQALQAEVVEAAAHLKLVFLEVEVE